MSLPPPLYWIQKALPSLGRGMWACYSEPHNRGPGGWNLVNGQPTCAALGRRRNFWETKNLASVCWSTTSRNSWRVLRGLRGCRKALRMIGLEEGKGKCQEKQKLQESASFSR